MADELSTYLAAALAKLGEPVDLTEAELDAAIKIKLKTTQAGLRVHVTWDEEADDVH
jgi:hypothetical protein